jgi:hypothetical protein
MSDYLIKIIHGLPKSQNSQIPPRACLAACMRSNQALARQGRSDWLPRRPPRSGPHGSQSTYGPDPGGTLDSAVSSEPPSRRAPPMQNGIFAYMRGAGHKDCASTCALNQKGKRGREGFRHLRARPGRNAQFSCLQQTTILSRSAVAKGHHCLHEGI